ncbi:MAG: nucleoid-associated protein YgaU [Cellvibrionaceae bacterium]|jgi:nucleoid-associated protein YgaU
MKIKVSGIVAALVLSVMFVLASHAADERFRDDFPERYLVQKGDTLWGISSKLLKTPWLWPEIWHANSQIANPHLIFPGDVISLVYIDGQPRLTVKRTTRLTPSGTDRLTPKIRVSPIDNAIPAIPLDQINSWLLRNRVVDIGILEAAPYVIAGQEQRLILGSGDRLYGRGQFANNIPNYGIYRKGVNYVDPDTKEILGVQAIDIGAANMRALDDDIATLSVTRSTGDVRIGDRILPTAERIIEPTFFPSQPDQDIKAKIIGVEGGVSQVGLLDVIAINNGERDGLEPGNVLSIYKRGESVKDPYAKKRKDRVVYLPDERAGLMMIFQTFDKMSLALVLKADRGIRVGDYVRQP